MLYGSTVIELSTVSTEGQDEEDFLRFIDLTYQRG